MFLDFVRGLDAFGINIKMTYDGHESFKTLFGAILSILVGLVIVSFFVYKTLTMVNRMDARTSKESFIRNLQIEPPLFAHREGFNFAFTSQ